MGVTVKTSGPLFDRSAGSAIDAGVSDAEVEVLQRGVDDVQAELGRVLKHPTGRYRRSIRVENRAVTDGGIVYGPWLEIGASRRHTRFRGYTTFRRVAQRLQNDAARIYDDAIGRRLG